MKYIVCIAFLLWSSCGFGQLFVTVDGGGFFSSRDEKPGNSGLLEISNVNLLLQREVGSVEPPNIITSQETLPKMVIEMPYGYSTILQLDKMLRGIVGQRMEIQFYKWSASAGSGFLNQTMTLEGFQVLSVEPRGYAGQVSVTFTFRRIQIERWDLNSGKVGNSTASGWDYERNIPWSA